MKLIIDGPVGKLEAIFETSPHPLGWAALVCHPHPVYGGTMHNRVVVRIARTLLAAGADVLRLNFRGAGASAGSYDGGVGEQEDAAAGLDYLKKTRPGWPLCVGGFSFGTAVGFRAGIRHREVRALLGAGLPIRHFGFDFLQTVTLPKWIIQGEFDEFGSGKHISDFLATCSEPRQVSVIPEADHFFSGRFIESFAQELERATVWLREHL